MMDIEKEKIADLLTQKEKTGVAMALDFSKRYISNATEKGLFMGGHLSDHVFRVFGYTALICQGEGWDLFLPLVTSLLMDLGRHSSDSRSRGPYHGYVSAGISQPFLESLKITDEQMRVVLAAIEDHPKLNNEVRISNVVMAVMDGDRLATLGPLGPMRAAATRSNLPLILPNEENHEFEEDKIKSVFQDVKFRQTRWFNSMWTKTGTRIGIEKYNFHIQYIKAVEDDVKDTYKVCNDLGLLER